MINVLLEIENYTLPILRDEILQQIKEIPTDSIVRFKMNNTLNVSLLNVKLLDKLIPATMNYQVAGLRDLYSKKQEY